MGVVSGSIGIETKEAAAIPAGLGLSSASTDKTNKGCEAQNVLDNCLSVQGQVLAMCSYSDWECKCQAQKSIAGCFNNCPSDNARAANEGQIDVFCNAAMRAKEEEDKKKSTSIKSDSPTKSAESSEPSTIGIDAERKGSENTEKSQHGNSNVSDSLAFQTDSAAAAFSDSHGPLSVLALGVTAWILTL
ncbi:Phospholipase D1 [Coemansia sp. RSA 1365]|nr:Phospholipase D1 [Coemansia sp. RSA 1365]